MRALTGEWFFYLAETIMRPNARRSAWNQADGLLVLSRSEDVSGGQIRLEHSPVGHDPVWTTIREFVMKRLACAIGLLALALTATSPARADYAVVQFGDGYCRIWWDSADTPWGVGWTKLVIGLPDHFAARAALDSEIAQGACR